MHIRLDTSVHTFLGTQDNTEIFKSEIEACNKFLVAFNEGAYSRIQLSCKNADDAFSIVCTMNKALRVFKWDARNYNLKCELCNKVTQIISMGGNCFSSQKGEYIVLFRIIR